MTNPYEPPPAKEDPRRALRVIQQNTVGVIATIWGLFGWLEWVVSPPDDRAGWADIVAAPQWIFFFVVCCAATVAGPVLATRARRPLLYVFFLAPASYVVFQIYRLWG